jgi:hypothetical protein
LRGIIEHLFELVFSSETPTKALSVIGWRMVPRLPEQQPNTSIQLELRLSGLASGVLQNERDLRVRWDWRPRLTLQRAVPEYSERHGLTGRSPNEQDGAAKTLCRTWLAMLIEEVNGDGISGHHQLGMHADYIP